MFARCKRTLMRNTSLDGAPSLSPVLNPARAALAWLVAVTLTARAVTFSGFIPAQIWALRTSRLLSCRITAREQREGA